MWKEIKQANNYYINEFGEIKDRDGKVKKTCVNSKTGYRVVDLYVDGKRKKYSVHRLVAEAFIPNPDNKPTVDHKNGNRQDNTVSNLRWATFSEQNSRFNTVGIRSERIKVTKYAENRKKRGGGHESWGDIEGVMYFNSITETAQYFNKTIGNISLLLKNRSIGRRGDTRGYLFEYDKHNQ